MDEDNKEIEMNLIMVGTRRIKQIIINPLSFFSLIASIALMTNSFLFKDFETGQAYTILDVILNFPRKEMSSMTECVWINVVSFCMGEYLILFMPVISSIAFVYFFCQENKTKNIRYKLIRISKRSQVLSEELCAFFSGGIIVLTGFLGMSLFAYLYFPHVSDIPYPELYKEVGNATMFTKRCFSVFLYGCLSTMPAIFFSLITKNEYLILTLSFSSVYFTKILSAFLGEKFGNLLCGHNIEIVNSEYVLNMFFVSEKWYFVLAVHAIGALLVLGIYYVIRTRSIRSEL